MLFKTLTGCYYHTVSKSFRTFKNTSALHASIFATSTVILSNLCCGTGKMLSLVFSKHMQNYFPPYHIWRIDILLKEIDLIKTKSVFSTLLREAFLESSKFYEI